MTPANRRRRRRLPPFALRLYVANRDMMSGNAIASMQQVLRDYLPQGSALEIVDLLREPQRGMEAEILVTPTLIKVAPAPVRRIFGDLSDRPKLLAALGLSESDRRA